MKYIFLSTLNFFLMEGKNNTSIGIKNNKIHERRRIIVELIVATFGIFSNSAKGNACIEQKKISTKKVSTHPSFLCL